MSGNYIILIVNDLFLEIAKFNLRSVSRQFSDFGSHSQLSKLMSKSSAYPSKHICDWYISKQRCLFVRDLTQEKHLPLEESYAHG